jgi:hypothetical protein
MNTMIRFGALASVLSLATVTGCAGSVSDTDSNATTNDALGEFDRSNPDIDVVRCGPVPKKPSFLLTFVSGMDGLVSAKVVLDATVAGRSVKSSTTHEYSYMTSRVFREQSALVFTSGKGSGVTISKSANKLLIRFSEYTARIEGGRIHLTSSDGIESTLRDGTCTANMGLIDAELLKISKDR